jgi:hypothetical protein
MNYSTTTKFNYSADDFDPIKIRQYLIAHGWEMKTTKKRQDAPFQSSDRSLCPILSTIRCQFI